MNAEVERKKHHTALGETLGIRVPKTVTDRYFKNLRETIPATLAKSIGAVHRPGGKNSCLRNAFRFRVGGGGEKIIESRRIIDKLEVNLFRR